MQHYKKIFESFYEQDVKIKPDNDINLFVGSSTFKNWTNINKDLAPYKILNRGFGGSTMAQLLEFRGQLILRYKFKRIFIYEGDNDIGKNPKKIALVLEQLKEIVKHIHIHQPKAKIYVLSLKCSPFRKKSCRNILLANKEFEKYCQSLPYLIYVDIITDFFDKNGILKEDFFKDGIHPSEKGYMSMAKTIKPYLFIND